MRLKPRDGLQYRHTVSKQLVDPQGFDADPHDLDIVRAVKRGDLVPVKQAASGRERSRATTVAQTKKD